MSKRSPFGNIPGLGDMMRQVQKMAEDTQKLEEELANERIGLWPRVLEDVERAHAEPPSLFEG